jgi:hypothetical protein
MNGIHEARGSIPLSSTSKSRDESRWSVINPFFIFFFVKYLTTETQCGIAATKEKTYI